MRSVVAALEEHVLPVVKGMDPRNFEAIRQAVWRKLNPRAMTGTISSALSCLDMACQDIAGKLSGHTIAELLGGARTVVPAYCTFGFPQYDREQLGEAARLAPRHGAGWRHPLQGRARAGRRHAHGSQIVPASA